MIIGNVATTDVPKIIIVFTVAVARVVIVHLIEVIIMDGDNSYNKLVKVAFVK